MTSGNMKSDSDWDPVISLPHVQKKAEEELQTDSTPHASRGALSRSRQQNRPHLFPFVAIVSATLFLILSSICNIWLSRKQALAGSLRRLSDSPDGDDNGHEAFIEYCLALEAEHGLSEQRATPYTSEDHARRIEQLVQELRDAAAEHESMQEKVLQDSPAGSNVGRAQMLESTDEEMEVVPSIIQINDGTEANAGIAPSSALLGDLEVSDAADAMQADAWLEDIPSIVDANGEQQAQLDPSVVSMPDDEQASTSASSLRPCADAETVVDETENICEHPYARIPPLAKGVSVRELDVENLFNPFRSRLHPNFFLLKFWELFAKQELNQQDANDLMDATEGLIGASYYHAKKPIQTRRPVYAAEALGIDFLSLDAISCAIQLVGDYMELPLWWNNFTKVFDRDASSILQPVYRRVSVFNRMLVKRLIDAVNIYRAGGRPPAAEIISLKKKLFRNSEAPAYFKCSLWDAWREDVTKP